MNRGRRPFSRCAEGWHLCVAAGVACLLLLATASWSGPTARTPIQTPALSMALAMDTGWLRRDDTRCSAAAGRQATAHSMTVWSDSAAVLFWQVPLADGTPYRITGSPEWQRRCERPSMALWMNLRQGDEAGRIHLPDAGRLPHLSWRWNATEVGVEDSAGRGIVSVGVTLTKRGTHQLREIAYVWSRNEPVGESSNSERDWMAGMVTMKTGRVVVHSGDQAPAEPQIRSIEEDMHRLFGERPGKLLRVYVKVHGGRRTRIQANVSDIYLMNAAAADSVGRTR